MGSPFLEHKGQAGNAGETARYLLAGFTLGNQNLPGAGSGFLQHRPSTGLTLGQQPSHPPYRGEVFLLGRLAGVQIPALLLSGCVTAGRSLGLSGFSLLISVMDKDIASFQNVRRHGTEGSDGGKP